MNNNTENRVSQIESTITSLLQHIKDVNQNIATGFEKIDKNFELVNDKIDSLKTDVNSLRGNSTASMETVENQLSDLTVEISKINEVTQYEGIFNNLKIIGGGKSE